MVQCHDRGGLGESVALDDQESELGKEGFQLGCKRSGADDEAPEFPTEQAVDFAVAPPLTSPMDFAGTKIFQFGKCLLEVLAQYFENLGDRNQNRDFARANLAEDGFWLEAAHENHYAGQHGRDEGSHGLAEHVA